MIILVFTGNLWPALLSASLAVSLSAYAAFKEKKIKIVANNFFKKIMLFVAKPFINSVIKKM